MSSAKLSDGAYAPVRTFDVGIDSPPPTPSYADEKAPSLTMSNSTRHLGFLGLLPTAAVVLLSSGFVVAILSYGFARQFDIGTGKGVKAVFDSGALLVYEGNARDGTEQAVNLWILTMSSYASTCISLTGTVLMSIVAYRAAACWLRTSTRNDGSNLSPTQYALLVGLLSSFGIANVWQSVRYTIFRNRRRSMLPDFFVESTFLAIIVYIVSHAVAICDLWLHSATQSMSTFQYVPDAQTSSLFGVTFNKSLCPFGFASDEGPCLTSNSGWGPLVGNTGYLLDQSTVTLTNSTSAKFMPITLHDWDDTAILIPGSNISYAGLSFTASTFGARAECISLNHLCSGSPYEPRNCSNMGYPGIRYPNQTSSWIFGMKNNVMTGAGPSPGPEFMALPVPRRVLNPPTVVLQLMWSAYQEAVDPGWAIPHEDYAVDARPDGFFELYAGCNITYWNVTAKYDPTNDSWSKLDAIPSSDDFATFMWAPLLYQMASQSLTTEIMGIAMVETYVNVTAALNQALGRAALAVLAGTFIPAPAGSVSRAIPVVLGRYPLAPLAVFLFLLSFYSLVAVVIFLLSWRANSKAIIIPSAWSKHGSSGTRSALEAAQMWLTTPMPLVAELFPGPDGQDARRSVAGDALDVVYDQESGPGCRLKVGLRPDGAGFGVYRPGRVVSMVLGKSGNVEHKLEWSDNVDRNP